MSNAQSAGSIVSAAAGAQIYLPAVSRSDAAAEIAAEAEAVAPVEQPSAVTATATVIRKYYYFGSQRVAMRQGSELRYLHWNHLGSTVMETSAAGSVLTDQKYYPFGAQRDAGPVATDHRFTGQKQDESGLYYYNARYYDPEIGQFISPDTLVPEPGKVFAYNRYMYAYGNALKYTDPSGHIAVCFRGGVNTPDKAEGETTAIENLCLAALSQAGYDPAIHGEIKYFDYNGLSAQHEAMQAILGRKAGEPAVIIGHSWGGAAALRLANDLNQYRYDLSRQPLVNQELVNNTFIDALITIDPERFGRRNTPREIPDNVRFAANIAPKDGWDYQRAPGLGGRDWLWNAQNGTNRIRGAFNVNLVDVYSNVLNRMMRSDHDTIVNLTAHESNMPQEVNPVTTQIAANTIRMSLMGFPR
ncbi:MAG: alpha/beta fold hydrolase [Caldilineaceae bacterium]|nr:alpha/beta fold hydrolase [Caldilineaceae bacterium]